jgi:hypothetical protein
MKKKKFFTDLPALPLRQVGVHFFTCLPGSAVLITPDVKRKYSSFHVNFSNRKIAAPWLVIKAQLIVGLSCAVPFEKIIVKNCAIYRNRREEIQEY